MLKELEMSGSTLKPEISRPDAWIAPVSSLQDAQLSGPFSLHNFAGYDTDGAPQSDTKTPTERIMGWNYL